MPYDLRNFSLAEMLRCGLDLRAACRASASLEEAAGGVVRHLRAQSADPATGALTLPLVRFYRTQRYAELPPDLQEFAQGVQGDPLTADTRCLTLVASAGEEAAWNSRHASRGHRAIPLVSSEFVERAPMIAGLLRELGVDVRDVIAPSEAFLRTASSRTYNVFHVGEAAGSPLIPAQDEFVQQYGIRSVVGFGGVVREELFAVILFSNVAIPRAAADRFRNLALDVKAALFGLDVPVFTEGAGAGGRAR